MATLKMGRPRPWEEPVANPPHYSNDISCFYHNRAVAVSNLINVFWDRTAETAERRAEKFLNSVEDMGGIRKETA